MLTARKFAQRAGITYPTVMAWLRKGLIPGAKMTEDSPLGNFWQIPAESLEKVQKQKTGPKPKIADDADDQSSAFPGTEEKPAKPAKKTRKAGSKKASKK